MIITRSNVEIGPRQHGHKMSLKAFEFAKVEEGYLYELARGYLVVAEVPSFSHMRLVAMLRKHFIGYQLKQPDSIYEVLFTMECKLPIPAWDSERHPDIAVYLKPPKSKKDCTVWQTWIPELVVEVVSESSRDRDYTEKRDEYWTLGIKEYWIVDAKLEQLLVLKRGRSQWTEKTLGPEDVCETKLLPGFKLPCQDVFLAGKEDEE